MRVGWIIYVQPNEATCVESAQWYAETINTSQDRHVGFGDTPNEAIGDLIGILTKLGPATIAEIHTRDSQGNVLYPCTR